MLGFLIFTDEPKKDAMEAFQSSRNSMSMSRSLTGDNELVARKICEEIGIPVKRS